MDPSTKTTPYGRPDQPSREPRGGGGGELSVSTLLIAAVASAVAAFVTSQVWTGGTLMTAALSPVIVALVKEGLARPAERVRTVRITTRSGRRVDVEVAEDAGERYDHGAPPPIPSTSATTGHAEHSPVTVYSTGRGSSRWTGKRVRIALITGLLAFAVVVVAYTVPELVAGSSLGGGGDHRTTLFGGAPAKQHKKTTPSEQATPTPTPSATAEPTVTPTATPSATPTPTVSATPTPTPTPSATP